MDEKASGAATDVGAIKVFMSYRRADDRHFIGRLHDRLCDAFGDQMVFRDIDSIPAGTNFRNVILRTLNEVDAVVAVIGPNWLRATDMHDAAAETDYVYLELVEALRQGKPMLPVLMDDTAMPMPEMLPADLRALSDINAISVGGDPAFRRDSARLIEAIGAVVAEGRAKAAKEQQATQERVRRVEAERVERDRLAEQLRAEERATRARLAELEEAATRRQIEQERARLDDIAEQLRHAESVEQEFVAAPSEPLRTMEPARTPVIPVDRPTTAAASEAIAARETSVGRTVELPWFEILVVAALILGVAGMFVNRSVEINGSVSQFNELYSNSTVDLLEWLLTLAIAVPLLLGRYPVQQRFVLAGVGISTFFYEFLQASGSIRFGPGAYGEGSWFFVKVLQTACLVGAYLIVRTRSAEPLAAAPKYKIPVVVITVASAALLVGAYYKERSDVRTVIDQGNLPGRSPFAVWIVLCALGPVAATVAMAVRATRAALITLGTVATLGALSYFGEATYAEKTFVIDGSVWKWLALSQVLLAATAWSATVSRKRSAAPSA